MEIGEEEIYLNIGSNESTINTCEQHNNTPNSDEDLLSLNSHISTPNSQLKNELDRLQKEFELRNELHIREKRDMEEEFQLKLAELRRNQSDISETKDDAYLLGLDREKDVLENTIKNTSYIYSPKTEKIVGSNNGYQYNKPNNNEESVYEKNLADIPPPLDDDNSSNDISFIIFCFLPFDSLFNFFLDSFSSLISDNNLSNPSSLYFKTLFQNNSNSGFTL